MYTSKLSWAAAVLALPQYIAAFTSEKVSHAEVTLDLEARQEVLVPGGVKTGKYRPSLIS